MTKHCFPELSGVLFTLLLAGSAQATSRHHDGEAKVWASGTHLCVGVADTYEVGGLFSRTKQVKDNQVMLHAVSMSRDMSQIWLQSLPPGSDEPGLRMEPGRCIEYGKLPEAFVAKTPAQPLQPGLYELYLMAGDRKSRRAWFYKRFCLARSGEQWRVSEAQQARGGWLCAP